jgi:peptidoglycan hydrolase CwlO-like protein
MKKFISGLVVGVLLFASTTVFADSAKSLLGKKVQGTFDVSFNGHQIGSAPVIDGSTYLPVRSISEAAGINISVEGKRIELTTTDEIVPTVTDAETDAKNRSNAEISAQIGLLKNKIQTYESNIKIERDEVLTPLEEKLKELETAPQTGNSRQAITNIEKKIADSNANITKMQAEIDAAEAEIKQLEEQLNK